MTSQADKFAALLRSDEMIVAPGAYDCITARMVDQAGYAACYMTGAGVAAIQIEDQTFPKRCGHLDNKEVMPLDELLPKIRAAASARVNPNFTIIARTDARAMLGFEEAVRRANAMLEAGADVAFVEAPQTVEEVRAVPKLVKGPCLLNMVWKGKTPEISIADAQAMGFRIMIFPGLLFKAAIGASDEALAELRKQGRHPAPHGDLTIKAAFARVGADEWEPLRERFRDPSLKLAG